MSDITYRMLAPEEYEKLQGLGPDDNWIPDPSISRIIVAERDGKLLGFVNVALQVHIEPVWIDPNERGNGLLYHLWTRAVDGLKGTPLHNFFAFSDSPEVDSYLERLGLRKVAYTAFMGGE